VGFLIFLSSLVIIFPDASLHDQVDLPANFRPAAIQVLRVDTSFAILTEVNDRRAYRHQRIATEIYADGGNS
jgi:hypothetical protein